MTTKEEYVKAMDALDSASSDIRNVMDSNIQIEESYELDIALHHVDGFRNALEQKLMAEYPDDDTDSCDV